MKPTETKTYLALGDSMSIDYYTDVKGGGAVTQLYKRLCARPGACWHLEDRTTDGFRMADIDFQGPPADLITMTVGGNDLLQNMDRNPTEFIPCFSEAYCRLAAGIRRAHPQASVIVGNIYQPQGLAAGLQAALDECNRVIGRWAKVYEFRLADIHRAFRGHEREYLCLLIEPTLKGASVIADLFEEEWNDATLKTEGVVE